MCRFNNNIIRLINTIFEGRRGCVAFTLQKHSFSFSELIVHKSNKKFGIRKTNMFAFDSNVVRPRRKATEAWINQHHHHYQHQQQQQQQRNSIFNVHENSDYLPVYDKNNHKIHKNEFGLVILSKY